MRAGLLREILVFKELVAAQSASGSIEQKYEPILTCRASRRKMSVIADRDGVNAMEQFIGKIIVFQTRNYPQIKENSRVNYRGLEYTVKMVDLQRDNTLVITLEKLNT